MALLSAFSVIRMIALLHFAIAYYLIVDPRKVAEHNVNIIISGALDMPIIGDFNKAGPITAFAGIVVGFLGLSDLIAVSLNEPVAVEYWSAVTPFRLVVLFPLTAYVYLYQPPYFSGTKAKLGTADIGALLKNNSTFSFLFLEVVMWFWVYVSMREQRRAAAQRVLEGKANTR